MSKKLSNNQMKKLASLSRDLYDYCVDNNIAILISTPVGNGIHGEVSEICSLFTMIIREFKEGGYSKDLMEQAINLGYMSEEEQQEELKRVANELVEKFKSSFGGN